MSKTPFTNAHPNTIGNGSLAATLVQLMSRDATDNEYMLGISYSPETFPGSSPSVTPRNGEITMDGSASPNAATIVLTVENGAANGDANVDVTFTITVAAAKVDWSSGAASAYTLKDVIDLINENDAGGTSGKLLSGFRAFILDAPYDLEINAADAIMTQAKQSIKWAGSTGGYTKCLSRDVSTHVINTNEKVYYKRIGFPESRDRGLFKFLDLWGSQTGTTSGEVTVYRDDIESFVEPVGTYATDRGNHEILFSMASTSLSANRGTTPGVPSGGLGEPETWRGPVVLAVQASNLTAAGIRIAMQAVSF